MIVGTRAPPRLPVAVERPPEGALDRRPSRAVTVIRSRGRGRRLGRQRGAQHGRERVGDLARAGIVGGDARDGEQPQVLRRASRVSPTAATHAPSASQPTGRQTPSHGLILAPAAAAETVRGVFGGRPRPRFGAVRPRRARRRGGPGGRRGPRCGRSGCRRARAAGADPGPPPGSPCSRSPSVRTIRSWPSAVSRTTWNQPSASETNSSEPSGSQRAATSTLRSPATTRDAPGRRRRRGRSGTVSSMSGPRRAMTAMRAPSGAQSKASTSTPVAVRTVGSGGLGSRGRPAAARDRRVDQPDLRPAAAARQERQAMAIGRPARFASRAGLADDPGQARAVGFDDPDLVVADERQATAVGRPLRIRDGLLRGGQLARIAATQREREQLACAGGLRGVGDHAVARVEAELARGVDRDDRLDRQVRATA